MLFDNFFQMIREHFYTTSPEIFFMFQAQYFIQALIVFYQNVAVLISHSVAVELTIELLPF